MLKILVCCGGGFSSSYVTERMKKEVVEKGLQEEVYLEFYPFSLVKEKEADFDIIMCCPHLKIYVERLLQETTISVPIYLLPPKMYGFMQLEEIVADAKDIIEIYRTFPNNPVHFPGEEKLLRITRGVAYRNVNKKR